MSRPPSSKQRHTTNANLCLCSNVLRCLRQSHRRRTRRGRPSRRPGARGKQRVWMRCTSKDATCRILAAVRQRALKVNPLRSWASFFLVDEGDFCLSCHHDQSPTTQLSQQLKLRLFFVKSESREKYHKCDQGTGRSINFAEKNVFTIPQAH